IASGKSVVAEEWRRLGALVVSGDKIGKQVVDHSPLLRQRLAREFGAQILTPAGNLRRKVLGRIVFGDPQAIKRLNAIVHPPLLRELRRQIKAYRKSPTAPHLIVDAALIFDWDLQQELDAVVVVESRVVDQLRRLRRLGMAEQEARQRISRQMTKARQRALADYILFNNSGLSELREKARKLFKKLPKSVDNQ
ncbi:MAG: dephospho-CoA kinase, partial [bacterium]